jgi:hypothetical protein
MTQPAGTEFDRGALEILARLLISIAGESAAALLWASVPKAAQEAP